MWDDDDDCRVVHVVRYVHCPQLSIFGSAKAPNIVSANDNPIHMRRREGREIPFLLLLVASNHLSLSLSVYKSNERGT